MPVLQSLKIARYNSRKNRQEVQWQAKCPTYMGTGTYLQDETQLTEFLNVQYVKRDKEKVPGYV